MSGPRIRLLVAGVLLFGWLGWLAYLAWFKTNPVVVSRSQAMAATRFVLADVTVDPATGLPGRTVRVVEDLRPLGAPLAGDIEVRNIREARIGGGTEGFRDPGPYLLMLNPAPGGFELTPPPKAPGHDSPLAHPQPWAYVWNAPGVKGQFDALVPPR